MSETKCKQCGQELPPEMLKPVRKTGVVKWVKADRKEAAVIADDELHRVWTVWCPTLAEVTLTEGDRVEVMLTPDKYAPHVTRIALLAPAPAEAEVAV